MGDVMRWIFLATWVGILLALLAGLWMMIRISVKLDQDHADRELTRHMLATAIRTAVQIAPEIRTSPHNPDNEPPQSSMGMDFGVGTIWQWLRSFYGGDRRSGRERRLGA